MHNALRAMTLTTALSILSGLVSAAFNDDDHRARKHGESDYAVELGPRPFYLVDGMSDGPLKKQLQQCKGGPFRRTAFSIGHRGAPLQFPEHTKESYEAAAIMGAGIVECDATFTKHGEFVCRHAHNDLHTTTNILVTALAATCKTPFTPPTVDPATGRSLPASAECRTTDLSLAEFKSLVGKMDAFNANATSVEQFVNGTASWRTDLYTGRGTLMTLRESIELNEKLGVKHTPELKAADDESIKRVFGTQERYALKFAEELRDAGVKPQDVWPQSFNANDVLTWIKKSPYGKQAVFLIDYDAANDNILLFDTSGNRLVTRAEQLKFLQWLRTQNVRVIAPAMPALLAMNGNQVVPSQLARDLKGMGFDIITWTFERSDLRQGASKAGFYYDFDPTGAAIKTDGDMYQALHVLAQDVKILGIFSDWPATVSYYASCIGLK